MKPSARQGSTLTQMGKEMGMERGYKDKRGQDCEGAIAVARPRTVDGELNSQDWGDRGCVAYTLRMASPREKEWIWGGEVEGGKLRLGCNV